ncbi:MAG: hypothetical protein BMS9Abin08_0732 [Gammaproteobacteria bacterium]|nr:MAG: hypothetical protein BMS9Abin08_0732 [Gammaproteobacteria bacterium]
MTRIVTITSGKAGVGKTAIAVNLAAQLVQHGRRVCLLDTGRGPANVSLMLGLRPRYTLRELLLGEATLAQVLIRNCHGFDIVPGSSRDRWMTAPSIAQLSCLADTLCELDDYDFILIDSASGIARHMLAFLLAGPEVMLVITPEPGSLTDAYALLKSLYAEHYEGRIHLVVNSSVNHTVGRYTYDKFREIIDFYLGAQLSLSGMLGDDPNMPRAMQEQQPLVRTNPDSVAARAIDQLAGRLLLEQDRAHQTDMQTFLARYLYASGVETVQETEAGGIQDVSARDSENLRQQIDTLSTRIDQLIAEIQCLRSAASTQSGLHTLPRAGRRESPDRCEEVCVAIKTEVKEVTLQGETFSIYHMQRSNGDTQRFACHSLDDDIQTPEPQTTSS